MRSTATNKPTLPQTPIKTKKRLSTPRAVVDAALVQRLIFIVARSQLQLLNPLPLGEGRVRVPCLTLAVHPRPDSLPKGEGVTSNFANGSAANTQQTQIGR